MILAKGFSAAGHDVRVVTTTREEEPSELPFAVVRDPSAGRLAGLVRWSELCFHNHIGLRFAWPMLVWRRPWVVLTHTWIRRMTGRIGFRDRLKLSLLGRARNLAVSRVLADSLGVPATVIANPYRDDLFRRFPGVEREGDLIFVGRLVSDKGADLLLEALRMLAARGVSRRLTVVGTGPERERLEAMAQGLDVRFVGMLAEAELARAFNAHRVLVVPSRWEEPFGLVALEGLACGCAVVASSGGGLPEAVGPFGRTFPNNDAAALADALSRELPAPDPDAVAQHLDPHRPERVVSRVLREIEEAMRR
jgi:glycosyltransferase involved in cell wall biosynthesis